MTVKTYQPQISIRLVKIIRRNQGIPDTFRRTNAEIVPGVPMSGRYGNLAEIDLTPYLGEQGGVKVVKGVREPAGAFSITFADQAHPQYAETMYALIEPMDLVEIRLAHDSTEYQGGKLPILMRGFVSESRRDEAMGHNGQPSRRVTICGQDFGKIWQILQICYLNGTPLGDNIISGFKELQKHGTNAFKNPPVKEWIPDVIKKIILPFINGSGDMDMAPLDWWNTPYTDAFSKLTPEVTAEGTVSGNLVQSWPGDQGLYYLLAHVCDVVTGFNEMYMEDREDGVYLVLRPTPWKTPSGEYVQDGAKANSLKVDAADLVSISVSRSDRDVANYFWVQQPSFSILSDLFMRVATQWSMEFYAYLNCDARVYGVRKMESYVHLGPPGWSAGENDTKAQIDARKDTEIGWMENRQRVLAGYAKDAVVFESGMIRVRGNEKIKAGMYLQIQRNQMLSEYYVSRVEHDFIPYQPFMTTCHVERGNGFIARSQQIESPYLSELTIGGA